VSPLGRANHEAGSTALCPSTSPVEDKRILAESLGYVPPVDGVELVAEVERGQVGVWRVKCAVQSTFHCPYHQLNPPLLPTPNW
jgi:hypothetical protein